MKTKTVGEELNGVLGEIHDTLWQYEADVAEPYDFPPEALRNGSKIFMAVVTDRVWKRIEQGGIAQEIAGKMATDCGTELREFIKKWTFTDVADFYK